MKQYIQNVLGIVVLVAMVVFAVYDHRQMPMVATDENGTVIAVDYRGQVYPSLEAAGLEPGCRYIHVPMSRVE